MSAFVSQREWVVIDSRWEWFAHTTLRSLVAASLLALTQTARADDGVGMVDVQIHGFVSQGFMLSTRNNYLAKSKGGSAEFSEVGINFTAPVTEQLRLGLQLFSRDLGPIGNYDVKADWFYLDYRFADWLGFRAGRIKVPYGLYNEINDVDSARVPILLPQSIYPTQNRDYLLAQTGGELYGRLDLEAAGALEYRAYGGTIYLELPEARPGAPIVVRDLGVPYVVGGRLLWEAPLEGLRLGGSVQALRLDTELLMGTRVIDWKLPVIVWVASLEYALGDLLLSGEYGRWRIRSRSDAPDVIPDEQIESDREQAYVMASYRVNDWLQPGAYYSLLFPDMDDRKGRETQQHDVSATLRFDLNQHWLFKLEGHYMVGTAGLTPALNEDRPLAELTRRWVAVFAKTTAYF
ncbi:MAG: hypothetical protein ABW217_03155 [Polyangiaceae bacterium]